MPHDVREGLLDDPVGGQAHGLGHVDLDVAGAELHRSAGPRRRLHQLPDLRQSGLGHELALRLLVAQHTEEPAHLAERLARGSRDGRELLAHVLRQPLEAVLRGVRLHRDDGHVVCHHVVQLAGDPGAFLQQRPPAALGLADRLLLGQPALHLGPLTEHPAQQERDAPEDGEQQLPGAVAVGCGEPQAHVRARRGQPHEDQRPAPLAQAQGEAETDVPDDPRGRERPQQPLREVDGEQRERPGHVRGEHHVPGEERPYDGEQQRRGLRDGQRGGDTPIQTVVGGEDHDGRGQQRDAQHERHTPRQQPHPPVGSPCEQRAGAFLLR